MASLHAGEEEMLNLLDALALADEPMFVIDDRHRIVFWNRAIELLVGRTHNEVAGRNCEAVLDGHDDYGNAYCADLCPVQLIARRGDPVRRFALHARNKAGEMMKFDVSVLKFVLRVSRRVLLVHVVHPASEPVRPLAPESARTQPRVSIDLTARETEILRMLADGRNPKQIADALGISPLTARNHVQRVLEKLGVHSQTEAVAYAWKMQLI